eukprot:CAMPEP_0184309218 /NCGR_PEP_ID=MMETSP1049-20130417/17452_1 /TAXON_ID=77928 /ORGANISM="Proteomonas sulcata, Strain CCMP704" /LENGTH=410 /DNA_ID=CAMNT_0026622069 /DNA_START=137 /DNA_END=1369 /DNA_ORIENTATION=+
MIQEYDAQRQGAETAWIYEVVHLLKNQAQAKDCESGGGGDDDDPVHLLTKQQAVELLQHKWVNRSIENHDGTFEDAMDSHMKGWGPENGQTGRESEGSGYATNQDDTEISEAMQSLVKTLHADGTLRLPPIVWDGENQLPCSFLVNGFGVQYWWFEVLESARKLWQTALIVFVYEGTISQIALSLLATFVFLMVSIVLKPHVHPAIGRLHNFSLITQLLTLFYGLMLVVTKEVQEPSLTNGQEGLAVEILMVTLNCIILLIPLFEVLLSTNITTPKCLPNPSNKVSFRESPDEPSSGKKDGIDPNNPLGPPDQVALRCTTSADASSSGRMDAIEPRKPVISPDQVSLSFPDSSLAESVGSDSSSQQTHSPTHPLTNSPPGIMDAMEPSNSFCAPDQTSLSFAKSTFSKRK